MYRAAGRAGGREVRVLLEQGALALGHPDGRAGALGQVGDAAEVVEVAVRDQDPGAGRAHAGELETQVGRVAARVDHGRLGRAAGDADDVAVGLERAEPVRVDDDAHRARV